MKLRISYTTTLDPADRAALEAYHGRKLSREDLKQLFEDLGELGVGEQVAEGRLRLDVQERQDARCRACGHSADDHDGYGGLCDGATNVDARTMCGCPEFQ